MSPREGVAPVTGSHFVGQRLARRCEVDFSYRPESEGVSVCPAKSLTGTESSGWLCPRREVLAHIPCRVHAVMIVASTSHSRWPPLPRRQGKNGLHSRKYPQSIICFTELDLDLAQDFPAVIRLKAVALMHPDHMREGSRLMREREADLGRVPSSRTIPASRFLRPGRPDPLDGDLRSRCPYRLVEESTLRLCPHANTSTRTHERLQFSPTLIFAISDV